MSIKPNKSFSSKELFEMSRQAESLYTDEKSLAKLAKVDNISIKYLVTQNPNCTTSLLQKLSTDRNKLVIDGVLSNVNTPPQIVLKLLQKRAHKYHRQGIANLLEHYLHKNIDLSDREIIKLLSHFDQNTNNIEIVRTLASLKDARNFSSKFPKKKTK